jgi:hypothetical protein
MENGCFKNIHSRRLFLAIFLGCERILIESKDYDWNISYLNIYLLFFFFFSYAQVMRALGWRIGLVIMKFKANNFPMNYTLFCLEKKKKNS